MQGVLSRLCNRQDTVAAPKRHCTAPDKARLAYLGAWEGYCMHMQCLLPWAGCRAKQAGGGWQRAGLPMSKAFSTSGAC